MAETSPSSNENAAGVTSSEINRLRRRTTASLTLSVLILALIVIGAIIHHHRMHHGFAGRDGLHGGCFAGQCQMGSRFHHFGGMGMNRGWGRPDGFRGGPGGPPPGMPAMGGTNAPMGGPMGKFNPTKVTSDGILNHLSTTLSLTDDQQAKIKPIIEQELVEIQKQMETQHQVTQKQVEDAKARIKPLLTADQQKLLDAIPLPGQKPAASDEANQAAPGPGQ